MSPPLARITIKIQSPPPGASHLYLFFSFTRTQILQLEWDTTDKKPRSMLPPEHVFATEPASPVALEGDALAFVSHAVPGVARDAKAPLTLHVYYFRDPPVLSRHGVVWTDASNVVVWPNSWTSWTSLAAAEGQAFLDVVKKLELTPRQALDRREAKIRELEKASTIGPRSVALRTMRLFFDIENSTYPSSSILRPPSDVAHVQAISGYLRERLRYRVRLSPDQPPFRIPRYLTPPTRSVFEAVEYRLRAPFETALGTPVDENALDELVFAFVMADAMPFVYETPEPGFNPDFRLEAMGAPNGSYYFLFSEFGISLLEQGFDRDFWLPVTRAFIWTLRSFEAMYWRSSLGRTFRAYAYAYACDNNVLPDRRQTLYESRRDLPHGSDLSALRSKLSSEVAELIGGTAPDTSPVGLQTFDFPNEQSHMEVTMPMQNYAVLPAHFDVNGNANPGSNGNDELVKQLEYHFRDLRIVWQDGNTPFASHQRAVHVRSVVEARLAEVPFSYATIWLKDPIPSKLNNQGGWDPIGDAVYFPVLINGALPQAPTFLIGIVRSSD